MTSPAYEVFAIKYAERDGRRPDHFIGGDPHDAPMPMDYFIWLIRDEKRVVVVDTGFDAAMAEKRGAVCCAFRALGVRANEVGDHAPA